jgi:hypothetical protein
VVALDLCGSPCLPLPPAKEGRGAPAAAKVDAPTPSHGFDLCHGDPVLLGEWVDGPQFADPPIGSWCSIHTVALDFRVERPRPLEPDPGGIPDHADRGRVATRLTRLAQKSVFWICQRRVFFATRFVSRRVSRVAIRFLVPRVEGAPDYDLR